MSNLKDALKDIRISVDAFNREMSRLEEEHKARIQKIFGEATKAFFQEWPEIECIHWNQYTPYWSDGDECVFGVNTIVYDKDRHFLEEYLGEDETGADEADDDWGYEGDPFINHKRYGNFSDEDKAAERARFSRLDDAHTAAKAMCEVVSSIDSDTMKSMFGDHVTVIVSKDGVVTEKYDHE